MSIHILPDGRKVRLGRKPARFDSRTFRLRDFMPSLPTIPATFDLRPTIATPPGLGVFLNDQLGDCVCAGACHQVQDWTGQAGEIVYPTDLEARCMYATVGGYDGTPETDNGCNMMDALRWWKKNPLAGVTITAYMTVDATNRAEQLAALYLFGGLYTGINCPQSALDNQTIWDYVPGSPNAGGHCIQYRPVWDGQNFTVDSWGQEIPTTPAFNDNLVEEQYVVYSRAQMRPTGLSEAGFDEAALLAALRAL